MVAGMQKLAVNRIFWECIGIMIEGFPKFLLPYALRPSPYAADVILEQILTDLMTIYAPYCQNPNLTSTQGWV